MHTITDCPRCGKDFMYHQTDVHLNREVLVGSNGHEHLELIVICQDCDEIEKRNPITTIPTAKNTTIKHTNHD
jgi:hypothetical protein